MGGARWDDWRTGCHLTTAGAASLPMCQLAWRSGCSAADRTITSSGGSAADVTQSAATGAAVEPLIAGCAAARPLRALHSTWASAARLRAWRVTGVAIWPAPHRAQRPASRSVRQAGLVHAQREGIKARGPRARVRAAACFSRLRRPDRVASGMEARQGRDAGTPVARRAARLPDPAQRGDAPAHRDLHADAAAPTPARAPSGPTLPANFTSPGGTTMTSIKPPGSAP